MRLRMRQICLVAHDLEATVGQLSDVFGLAVCFKDPSVAKWGLDNALLPVGNGFLEVVAPVQAGTAAGRYLERRRGDGGYMVILQCDRMQPYRDKAAALGVRLVYDYDEPTYAGMQFHPRDVPPAILSVDWTEGDPDDPESPWHPAGDDWKRHRRTGRVAAMRAAEVQADDPAAIARRWGELLGLPVAPGGGDRAEIRLEDAVLRFVPVADGRGPGLGGVDLAVADRAGLVAAAERAGCPVEGDTVTVCGTRFRLV